VIWYHPVDFYSRYFTDRPEVSVVPRPYRVTRRTVLGFWWRLVRLRPRVVVFVKGIADAHPWYAYLAARLSGARRVFAIEHLIAEPPPPPRAGNGWRARLRRRVSWRNRYLFRKRLEARLLHQTVCVSNAVRNRLVDEYGYPAGRARTIYCGIDLSRFPAGATKRLPSDETAKIVCVARLSRVKRIDVLLEALRLLRSASVRWHCSIVGGGPMNDELRRLSETMGLADRVEFTGQVDDVRPILARANLLALSSDLEGLPLVIMEAMASGVPCVVTDVGGNREIVIDGQTGLIVPPREPERLARAIESLLVDDEERMRMGERARQFVREHFDAAASWVQYRELLSA